jgi:hypothetical protein
MSDTVPGYKMQAVLQIFPDLDKRGFTNEEIAEKVKEKTGVDVAPGYVKHIFRHRQTGGHRSRRKTAPQPIVQAVLHAKAVDVTVPQQSAEVAEPVNPVGIVKETLALAKKVGGLKNLYALVECLLSGY